jgi:DNA-binding NtrC family response regulator
VFRTRPIVLIVEDDPVIAMTYEDAAIDAGASVGGPFLSCESAEEWLNIHSPDVAIIDVKLQDGCSAQLAKKLCDREIPFVVVSGYSADSVGIDPIFKSALWLEKPFVSEVLESALHTMLESEPSA